MACKASWLAVAALALAACAGVEPEEEATPIPMGARRLQQSGDSAVALPTGPLRREVFAYGGGGRDPFESLMDQANVGPELPDLILLGVMVDLNATTRNTAVLRDRVDDRRYVVHEGDRLGRLQILSIREGQVTFLVDDFGVRRQETLALRKPEGATP